MEAKLGNIYCVLCSVLIIIVQGQFNGPYLPHGSVIPRHQGKGGLANGPHGGGQHPGTGTGYWPQYPPPERPGRPAARPRPKPPLPPVVTPHPITPNVPPQPTIPVVRPDEPIVPVIPTGVSGHIPRQPPTEDHYEPIIPVTPPRRRDPPKWTPYRPPRPYPRFTLPPVLPTLSLLPCAPNKHNQCSNRGSCIMDPIRNTPTCRCRDLYAGERCQLVLKPPKNITMVDVAPTYVSVSWIPPPVDKRYITGFVVQYNKFGSGETRFTPHIHPGVAEYTLRDLEPESQYTICINIIFKNITAREAVLRDQCLEIRTQPDEFNNGGISLTFMALIVGAVVLVLVLIMVMALLIQRRCLKPIREPMRTLHRAMTRRSVMVQRAPHHKHNANHHNHLHQPQRAQAPVGAAGGRDQEAEACVKVHRIPPGNSRRQHSNPFFARLQTNNANNHSDYKDWALPVSVNYSRLQVPDVQPPPRYTRSSSCSIAPPPRSTNTRQNTELSTFGHQRKNPDLRSSRSVPPHATIRAGIRALPPSISNQVMRSKNAREKDASSEFDVRGTYMYFAAPGQNLTT